MIVLLPFTNILVKIACSVVKDEEVVDDYAFYYYFGEIVKNGAGENVMITTTEDGYNVSDGTTAMNFVFDKEEQIWSAEYNNQVTKLVKLNGDNTAQIFVGEDVVDVNLDAEGINMAYMLMNNSFAMNK